MAERLPTAVDLMAPAQEEMLAFRHFPKSNLQHKRAVPGDCRTESALCERSDRTSHQCRRGITNDGASTRLVGTAYPTSAGHSAVGALSSSTRNTG